MIDPNPMPAPPPETLGEPDEPARRLWSRWRQGQQPRVQDFLAQAGIQDPGQILEVLLVDQAERFRLGQGVPAETYLAAFPTVRDDPEQAVDLIFAEYLLREERGEQPAPEDYLRRFPQHAGALKLQVELHEAMGADPEVSPTRAERSTTLLDRRSTGLPTGSVALPTIPGYEIRDVLGWGGMGVVYRAWQTRLNRPVAVKMVHAGAGASPAILARFRVEAEAVARLQHPHIVQVHDVGYHAGSPFLVLELVEGRSLVQRVAGTPQPAPWAAELVETLARAIHAAHQQGVVHRDLTPANILLTADDRPKITDFGLAKLVIGGGDLRTQTGELLGTPSYMAPEQAASRHQAIGAATDVYALGAILFEVLTGRPPFRAESALETLRQVMADEPVAPSRLRPKLPHDLETICLKCLRKEPAQRYSSAAALAEDLRRFRDGRPILARRSSAVERGWRWCRRHPAVAGWLGSVAALLLILAAGSLVAALRLQQAQRRATEELWEAYLAQARASRWSGRVGRRFDGLEALAKAAALATFPERRPELLDEAIACLPLIDLRAARQWRAFPPGSLPYLAVDPLLRRYVRFEGTGTVSVRRVADDAELFRFPSFKSNEYWPLFSPDGRFLVVATNLPAPANNYQVWDLDRGETVRGLPPCANALGFRPDARQVAIAQPEGGICLFDLPAVTLARQWQAGGVPKCVAFHPVEAQLALAWQDSSEIRICDRETGRRLQTLPNPAPVDELAWRGDGRILAAACGDKIQIWDLAAGRLLSVLEGHRNNVERQSDPATGVRLAFNHRGDLLASVGWDEFTRLWDPVSGRQHLSLPGTFLSWGPDDQGLVHCWLGSLATIYQVADGAECRILPHGLIGNRTPPRENGPMAVDFSPDGRLLASASIGGVRIYRAVDGRELSHLPIGFCESALFQVDGDLLTYNHETGLARWPVRNAGDTTVRVGPPELLNLPSNDSPTNRRVAGDRRGEWLAATDFGNAQVVLLSAAEPRERTLLRPHLNVAEVAISPDGRWVATGTWIGTQVKIWDTTRGTLAAELPGSDAAVGFSPDGRWLVAGAGDAYRSYRVGSWQPGWEIARDTGGGRVRGPLAFHPDGRALAIVKMVQHQPAVQLIDPASSRAIATLGAPEVSDVARLAFSPEGRRLAVATDGHRIQLWDLRRVRQRLAAMRLDPDFPPETATDRAGAATPPVERVVVLGVDPGSLRWLRVRRVLREFWDQATQLFDATLPDAQAYIQRAQRFERLQQWKLAAADLDQAIQRSPKDSYLYEARAVDYLRLNEYARASADLQRALELDADRPETCNNLAWICLTGPRELRDPTKALSLAQRAVESRPGERTFRNTLGVAYYRLGQFAKAVETLEANVKFDYPLIGFDWLFLAMSHQRMGQSERARSEFDRAVRWRLAQGQLDPSFDADFQAFRTEAGSVLAGPPGP
jgi:WD40 repeat protein/tetratricopeptide (TPR) repeat protein